MSRLLRSGCVAALTLAACAVAGTASAQTYNRLVVFGDSLSDNGNLFAVTGGTQPPASLYFNGRFSTGPVFTELLGFNTGRFTAGSPVTGSTNYAFGGAVTGLETRPGAPPGMRDQLNAYTAAGGKFGPGDLVSILGGANNIFQGLPAAGASVNPAAAIRPVALNAATDMNFIVNAVAGAGAGTILVTNLPKLSLTPQFRTSPAAPLADFAVTTFNGALLSGLMTTAAARPGTNIIMMDLFKIGDVVAANPGLFGIANITDPCINQTTFVRCSAPNTYFYIDGVHPTALGHQIIAALADDYLYYGDAGAGTALQGETAYRHREDGLHNASDVMSSREGWEAGTGVTVAGLIDNTETDARGTVAEAESRGRGARIALESGSEAWRFGLAGSYRTADVVAGAHSFDLSSMALDVYAGWRSGGLFLNAAAGMGRDDYNDVSRNTTLGPIAHSASTDGWSRGARGQAGVWLDMGGIAISPRAAVTWVSTEVEGYAEQGAAATYQYADRTVEAITAEVSLRAETEAGPFGLFVEGGYRDSLDDNSDAVRTGIAGNPAQVLSRFVDEPFGGQVLASAGLEGDMGPLKVAIGYRGRFGDHADSHTAGISFTLPLQ
jgi:outer membrane lipase/esterase